MLVIAIAFLVIRGLAINYRARRHVLTTQRISNLLVRLEKKGDYENSALVALALDDYEKSGKWPKDFAKNLKIVPSSKLIVSFQKGIYFKRRIHVDIKK